MNQFMGSASQYYRKFSDFICDGTSPSRHWNDQRRIHKQERRPDSKPAAAFAEGIESLVTSQCGRHARRRRCWGIRFSRLPCFRGR